MSREWRLNPPPNWPLAAGVVVGLDWRPDPTWGPPPIGWQLWRRERVSRWRPLPQTVLGLMLGTITLVGVLVGEPANTPAQSIGRTTVIEPGTFPAGSFYGLQPAAARRSQELRVPSATGGPTEGFGPPAAEGRRPPGVTS